jgi:ascorbate-specific PTS system EIIC-type component UlaA
VLVPLLLGVLFLFAVLIHQWWVIALPLTLIPLFYAGLASGWWGAGVGDGWQLVAVAATVLALLAATLGVAAGRVATREARRDRPRVRR